MALKRAFEMLWDLIDRNFKTVEVVMIPDSCFGGGVARGSRGPDRSVEIVDSVGINQLALGNANNLARDQKMVQSLQQMRCGNFSATATLSSKRASLKHILAISQPQ